MQGDDTALDNAEIPKGSTVVTVCDAGRISLLPFKTVSAQSVDAYSLEGGIKAWNYTWNKAELILPNGVKVVQVRRAAKGVLSYIVGSDNEAVVIDAALNPEVYLNIARENKCRLNMSWTANTKVFQMAAPLISGKHSYNLSTLRGIPGRAQLLNLTIVFFSLETHFSLTA